VRSPHFCAAHHDCHGATAAAWFRTVDARLSCPSVCVAAAWTIVFLCVNVSLAMLFFLAMGFVDTACNSAREKVHNNLATRDERTFATTCFGGVDEDGQHYEPGMADAKSSLFIYALGYLFDAALNIWGCKAIGSFNGRSVRSYATTVGILAFINFVLSISTIGFFAAAIWSGLVYWYVFACYSLATQMLAGVITSENPTGVGDGTALAITMQPMQPMQPMHMQPGMMQVQAQPVRPEPTYLRAARDN
jgi:hypothetical protein